MKNPAAGLNGVDLRPLRSPIPTMEQIWQARQATANQRGTDRKTMARMTWITIIAVSLAAVSVTATIFMATMGIRTEARIFKVDALGHEQELQRYPSVPLKPQESAVADVLFQWVRYVRRILDDPVGWRDDWDDYVRAYCTSRAWTQLQDWRKQQQERYYEGKRVQVDDISVMPIAKAVNSYTVEWQEKTYLNGNLLPQESDAWKGILTIADFQSKAALEEFALKLKRKQYRNSSGIFVDSINWGVRTLKGR